MDKYFITFTGYKIVFRFSMKIIVPLKFDFCLGADGKLRVLDIGDGFSCGSDGFFDRGLKLLCAATESESGLYCQPALDGEVPLPLIKETSRKLMVSCFGNTNEGRSLFPVSGLSRYIVMRLMTLIVEGRVSNGYSSTLYGVEMYKIFCICCVINMKNKLMKTLLYFGLHRWILMPFWKKLIK